MQKYLDLLQNWLSKWRLKIAGNKCSYNIYTKVGHCKKELNLRIFNEPIKKENNIKYLGIYIDRNLNFNYHIKMTKQKCIRKLNFLKVLSGKKWNTSVQTKRLFISQ